MKVFCKLKKLLYRRKLFLIYWPLSFQSIFKLRRSGSTYTVRLAHSPKFLGLTELAVGKSFIISVGKKEMEK